ncbi:MAG: recombination mediator RecR [Cyclobacteriaceae bacterium]|nr:recombination mediator RecR [Cyclobacteriaceae bacterium]
MTIYPSRLIEEAVTEISRLPGIGKKSALRLVLHLLKREPEVVRTLANAIIEVREKTSYCKTCGNIADREECAICTSHKRDKGIICIVEDSRDVLAIENTGQYNGVYHVLGGVISPIDGIGPDELSIQPLINRLNKNPREIKEIIMALSPTMEGDTTAFYVSKKIKSFSLKISSISRGIPIGGELEYTDEITLGRSILSRISYQTGD